MTWTYSGDPSKSDLDKYRFLVSDTVSTEPVLQDEEINFILTLSTDQTTRLFNLFDKAADIFARAIKRSLGPQHEDPTERLKYFRDKAAYYRRQMSIPGLPAPCSTSPTFTKGMFDNTRTGTSPDVSNNLLLGNGSDC